MLRWQCFFILLCYVDVAAAECDSAQTLFTMRDALVPMQECGNYVRVGVADVDMFPDLACPAGVKKIRTSTGVGVSLYSQKVTTPALCVRYGDAICYANLVLDTGANLQALKVLFGGNRYKAVDLSLCFTLETTDSATLVRSPTNVVIWRGELANKTVMGVSYCSDYGGISGDVQEALSVSSDMTDNRYCWCRTSVPLLSQWVYSMEFASDLNCNKYCSAKCAENFVEDMSWRKIIWGNFYSVNK